METGSDRRLVIAALVSGLFASAGVLRADVIVPTSAYVINSLGDDFQTDVRVYNPTNAPVVVTPIFYRQANGNAGITADTVQGPDFTIPARGQLPFDNILVGVFGQTRTLAGGPFGPIRFQTSAAIFASSATNNVNGCSHTGAVQGQWIPGLDVSAAKTSGTLLQLAASTDPATGYRTNVVFMNPSTTSGASVTATLHRGDGSVVSTAGFALGTGPAAFKQINRFSTDFSPPVSLTDTDLYLEFTSDQPILAVASVINNISGDPFAITPMAAASTTPPGNPASFTVSANPTAGQPVTFTDTTPGAPPVLLWSFGDGSTGTGSPAAHTYAAAGTYRVAHFAANGSTVFDLATKDVAVATGAPQPIAVTITASQWSWSPQNVNLTVGQPYQITFRNDPTAPNVRHGVGGLLILGAPAACNFLNPSCTWNFTPTAAHLLLAPGGVFPYGCTQSACGSGHISMTAGSPSGGTLTIVP